jgi:TorA maturation chaperone TorD
MVELITAFRDFFYYGRQAELERAYSVLGTYTTSLPMDGIDWEQEEFIFNRLFVGPAAPKAPLVASVYLDPENLIQNRITAEIREFYQSIGLALPELGREPEDSLTFELDACRYLLSVSDTHPEAEEIYRAFINEHIALWLPLFIEKAKENCESSKAIRHVLGILEEWISVESEKTILHKELS